MKTIVITNKELYESKVFKADYNNNTLEMYTYNNGYFSITNPGFDEFQESFGFIIK